MNPLNRRAWMGSVVLLAGASRGTRGWWQAGPDVFEAIQAKARRARMQPFEATDSKHFRAIGDASARHRQDAIQLCEAFAADYFAHFRARGFTLDWPAERLPVVVLANPTSYAAFEQDFVDEAEGGSYDKEANWLVTFDFQSTGIRPRAVGAADPRVDNTLALVHEVLHQLSYNTGMLDRKADIPLCLAEGLAEYAETWRPGRQDVIGSINRRRRLAIEQALRAGLPWISVRDLLGQDDLQNDAKAAQLARGEAWLLVHKLIKDAARLPHFRDYLKAVQAANDPARRVELATAHLGDLDKLDRDLRR